MFPLIFLSFHKKGFSGHFRRLFPAHDPDQCGYDIRQTAALSQRIFLIITYKDERHLICGMGCKRFSCLIIHKLLRVAVVRTDKELSLIHI